MCCTNALSPSSDNITDKYVVLPPIATSIFYQESTGSCVKLVVTAKGNYSSSGNISLTLIEDPDNSDEQVVVFQQDVHIEDIVSETYCINFDYYNSTYLVTFDARSSDGYLISSNVYAYVSEQGNVSFEEINVRADNINRQTIIAMCDEGVRPVCQANSNETYNFTAIYSGCNFTDFDVCATPVNLTQPLFTIYLTVQIDAYVGGTTIRSPLPNIRFSVWEEDLLFDDHLYDGQLNSAGTFTGTVSVFPEIPPIYDIYVTFCMDSGLAQMFSGRDIGNLTPYCFKTPTESQDLNQRVNIVYHVDYKFVTATTAYYNFLVPSLWAQSLGNKIPSTTVWLNSGGNATAYLSPKYQTIAIGGNFYKAPLVIAHEYGHWVMFILYNGGWPDYKYDEEDHSFCPAAPVPPGFAWSEGYATAFSLISTNTTSGNFYWVDPTLVQPIEKYSCKLQSSLTDEGRVAAAIWDLYDTPNDSNGGNLLLGRNGYSDNNALYVVKPQTLLFDALFQQPQNYEEYLRQVVASNSLSPIQRIFASNVSIYNWG
jgi:hypothetical protein